MKQKLLFLHISLIVTLNLSAQNIQNFLGKYEIQANCIVDGFDGYSEFHTYNIEIEENTEENSNIKFFFNKHGINDYVRAMVLNDNNFDILPQQFSGEEGFEPNFIGDGKIRNDSIFMQYHVGAENVIGTLICDCKGKKKNTSNIVSPLEPNKSKIYLDATKQVIVIDETLQNQSLTFELINMQGSTILKKSNLSESINIANLPSGIYLCRILQNGRIIYSDKIVKK